MSSQASIGRVLSSRGAKSRKEVTIVEIVVFGIVILLWAAFAVVLAASPSSIDEVWQWFTDRSLLIQIPLGAVFLPWLIAIWIWEASWPLLARGVLVTGLAWANLYAFSPWKI